MINHRRFLTDEIQAHTQKVTCLDLGETGRVLVTGGQDRNVNLWAFGNEKCFMVSTQYAPTKRPIVYHKPNFVYFSHWPATMAESTV